VSCNAAGAGPGCALPELRDVASDLQGGRLESWTRSYDDRDNTPRRGYWHHHAGHIDDTPLYDAFWPAPDPTIYGQ
jgi:hypothetical protein